MPASEGRGQPRTSTLDAHTHPKSRATAGRAPRSRHGHGPALAHRPGAPPHLHDARAATGARPSPPSGQSTRQVHASPEPRARAAPAPADGADDDACRLVGGRGAASDASWCPGAGGPRDAARPSGCPFDGTAGTCSALSRRRWGGGACRPAPSPAARSTGGEAGAGGSAGFAAGSDGLCGVGLASRSLEDDARG